MAEGYGCSRMEHVNNAYAPGHANAGQQTKHASQWVASGAYGMLKRLDPTFAQQVPMTVSTRPGSIDRTRGRESGSSLAESISGLASVLILQL